MQQQWQWHRDSGRNMMMTAIESNTAHGTTIRTKCLSIFESKWVEARQMWAMPMIEAFCCICLNNFCFCFCFVLSMNAYTMFCLSFPYIILSHLFVPLTIATYQFGVLLYLHFFYLHVCTLGICNFVAMCTEQCAGIRYCVRACARVCWSMCTSWCSALWSHFPSP